MIPRPQGSELWNRIGIALLLLVGFTARYIHAEEAPAPAKLTSAQKTELRKAVSGFKKAKTAEEEDELTETIFGFGPLGAKEFLRTIDKQYDSKASRYLKDFAKQAGRMEPDLKKDLRKEVERARDSLAALRAKGNGLTKEDTVSKGDPAFAKLKELLLVSPADVHTAKAELAEDRGALLRYGQYLSRCQELVAELPRSSKRKKSKKKSSAKGSAVAPIPEPSTPEVTLRRHEVRIVLIETLATKLDKGVLELNTEEETKIDGLEASGILDLNLMRMLMGLQAVRIDPLLCDAARDHSSDMRTKNFFAHDSPVPGKKTFSDRAKRFGVKAWAENIAHGKSDPAETNMQWFHSPGHHVNMLNPKWKAMGLGRSVTHWTQMFR